ncbi:ABC transporter permease [Lacipirellula sp.]|uniref:ABC transporter permease n=1 Tax=Lacipirellula sp. TaxID=2691419 RepID=UPI003D0A135A
MSYFKIAWRNMQERALASSLTGLSMALGVALMVLVLVIHEVVVAQLSNDAQGYNFIVAGKGSPYEIVLTTVFHVGKPLYPIPWKYYQKFVDGEFAQYTDLAVPICLGDSYPTEDGQLFRVVGTTPEMFDELSYGADSAGNELKYEFSSGRNFRKSHFFEAVVGSVAANRTGLKVGDRFRPSHGMSADGDKHDEFEVVGILAPTGTANDRALFVNVEGFLLLDGHARADRAAEDTEPVVVEGAPPGQPAPLPIAQREVTSILVRCDPEQMMAPMAIDMGVNKGDDLTAQAVAPVTVVERLQSSFLAPMRLILLVLTVMIVIVAGISILVSIYNSMSERSHDIAVMRALGASRNAVMAVILVESILLSLLGGIAGLLLGHGVLALASPVVEYYTGVTVRAWSFSWQEMLLVPGLVTFAALVGFLPALSAYRTDVAKTLGGAR